MSKLISEVYYNLVLLNNIDNSPTGGVLIVDTYTFDPKLIKGDIVNIEDWKIGVVTQNEI